MCYKYNYYMVVIHELNNVKIKRSTSVPPPLFSVQAYDEPSISKLHPR